MTDRILIATPPDDTLIQGIRIVHVNLDNSQSALISSVLLNLTIPDAIINYVWNVGNSVGWLLDKVQKSDLILFNAETNDLITGWISAQPKSYYFGNLKDLHLTNNRAIYSVNDISTLLEKISKRYEQI